MYTLHLIHYYLITATYFVEVSPKDGKVKNNPNLATWFGLYMLTKYNYFLAKTKPVVMCFSVTQLLNNRVP